MAATPRLENTRSSVKLKVLTAVPMSMLSSLMYIHIDFALLKMGVPGFSKTFIHIYQTILSHIPKGSLVVVLVIYR